MVSQVFLHKGLYMLCFLLICHSLFRVYGFKVYRFRISILRVYGVSFNQTSPYSRKTKTDEGNRPARDQKPKVAAEAAMTL